MSRLADAMAMAMQLCVAVTACLSSISALKVLLIQSYGADGCSGSHISFFLQHFNFGTCTEGPRKITKVDDTTVQLTMYKDWDSGCVSTRNGFSNILRQINVTSSPSCLDRTEYTIVTLPTGYATINYTRFTDFSCEREDSQMSVNPIVQIAGPACEPTIEYTKNGAGFRKRRCSSTNTLTEDFYSDPDCTGNPFRSLVRASCRVADGESIYWHTAILCLTTTSTTMFTTTSTSTSMSVLTTTSSMSVFTSTQSLTFQSDSATKSTSTSPFMFVFVSTPTSTSPTDSAKQSVAVAKAFQHKTQALLLVLLPTALGTIWV